MVFSGRHPDRFHRPRVARDYFEGWYFKLVDAKREHVWAIIPGVQFGAKPDESHSFVQVVRGDSRAYTYVTYSTTAFGASARQFRLQVGNNHFSGQGLSLDIQDPELKLRGDLEFSGVIPWPDSFWNPGSMGFWNYVPNLQCYSQVSALDLDLSGSLWHNGRELDFSGGKGYIEKNWGRAFPYAWVWIQSNHFGNRKVSLSCSLGQVPFGGFSFRGFLIGLLVDSEFFGFTTMNRSRCRLWAQGRDVFLEARNSRYALTLETRAPEHGFIELKGPREGRMVPLVEENLAGEVRVSLQRKDGTLIFAGTGQAAGIEYGGKQELLLEKQP